MVEHILCGHDDDGDGDAVVVVVVVGAAVAQKQTMWLADSCFDMRRRGSEQQHAR